LLGREVFDIRGDALTPCVVNEYRQARVHAPLETSNFISYAPISAGDSETLRLCIVVISKDAVGTLQSGRERWLVLSISNRPITE
jgi:hypothetical protein